MFGCDIERREESDIREVESFGSVVDGGDRSDRSDKSSAPISSLWPKGFERLDEGRWAGREWTWIVWDSLKSSTDRGSDAMSPSSSLTWSSPCVLWVLCVLEGRLEAGGESGSIIFAKNLLFRQTFAGGFLVLLMMEFQINSNKCNF
jgi:hypothetical protein